MRDHIPLTARFVHIRNRIHDFTDIDGSSSPTSGLLANKWHNIGDCSKIQGRVLVPSGPS